MDSYNQWSKKTVMNRLAYGINEFRTTLKLPAGQHQVRVLLACLRMGMRGMTCTAAARFLCRRRAVVLPELSADRGGGQ